MANVHNGGTGATMLKMPMATHAPEPQTQRLGPGEDIPPVHALLLACDARLYRLALLTFCEKPLLYYLLKTLIDAGVRRLEIVTPPMELDPALLFREIATESMEIQITSQSEGSDSMHGLAGSRSQPGAGGILILEADMILHASPVRRLLDSKRSNALLTDFSGAMPENAARLEMDADHRILTISRTLDGLAAQGVSLGVLKASAETFDRMREEASRHSFRDLDRALAWVAERDGVHALACGELPWLRVRDPGDLQLHRDRLMFLLTG